MALRPKPTYSDRSFASGPPRPGPRTEMTQSFQHAAAAPLVQVQGGRAVLAGSAALAALQAQVAALQAAAAHAAMKK